MDRKPTFSDRLITFCNSVLGTGFVGFIVAFAGFINFIQFNHYPFFSLGVFLNIIVFGISSALMAIIYARSPQSIKNFLIFVLGVFGLGLYVKTIWGYLLLILLYMIVKSRLMAIYAVLSFVIIVTAPIKLFMEPNAMNTAGVENNTGNAPFILHLVMDEYIGLKGLGSYERNTDEAKDQYRRFFNDNGFSIFEGAYSKQAVTVNSLPIIFNFGDDSLKNNGLMNGITLERNQYFDLLQDKGYKIKVFQSDWIDYCQHPAIYGCETMLRSGPMPADIDQSNLSLFERTWVVGYPFLSNSLLTRILFTGLDKLVLFLNRYGFDAKPVMAAGRHQIISPYGLKSIEQLNNALGSASSGEVYFAHVIFPHSPYIFDADCNLKAYSEWADHLWSTGPRAHREMANIEQNSCANLHIEALLDKLRNSAVKDNFIVIIHGDHGSRITEVIPDSDGIERASEDDIIKSFSTLFAVRYQLPNSKNIDGTYSLDYLLEEIARNNFKPVDQGNLNEQDPYVFINDAEWQPEIRIPLPPYK